MREIDNENENENENANANANARECSNCWNRSHLPPWEAHLPRPVSPLDPAVVSEIGTYLGAITVLSNNV